MGRQYDSAYVYFARPIGMPGPVKIGCSRLPERRLEDLMLWSPFKLGVAARIPGNITVEQRFHAKFAHLHSHREWFTADPELDVAINAINAGTFDVEALPAAKRLYRPTWTPEQRKKASLGHCIRRLERDGAKLPAEIVYAFHGRQSPEQVTEAIARVEAHLAALVRAA